MATHSVRPSRPSCSASSAIGISFKHDEAISLDELQEMCTARGGDTQVLQFDSARYVGARIGIYNPRGEKVGRISHLRNTEYLFVVTPRAAVRRPGAAKHRPRRAAAGVSGVPSQSKPSTEPCPATA